jgi:hypothetical protein
MQPWRLVPLAAVVAALVGCGSSTAPVPSNIAGGWNSTDNVNTPAGGVEMSLSGPATALTGSITNYFGGRNIGYTVTGQYTSPIIQLVWTTDTGAHIYHATGRMVSATEMHLGFVEIPGDSVYFWKDKG